MGTADISFQPITTMRNTKVIVLSGIVIFAIWSLVSGAAYLEWGLPGGLPLGNALAAVGLAGLAGIAVEFSRQRSVLRKLSWISLGLAVAWLPVSIALAGNLELTFSGGWGTLWIGLTFGIAAVVLGCAAGAVVSRIWDRLRCVGAD